MEKLPKVESQRIALNTLVQLKRSLGAISHFYSLSHFQVGAQSPASTQVELLFVSVTYPILPTPTHTHTHTIQQYSSLQFEMTRVYKVIMSLFIVSLSD